MALSCVCMLLLYVIVNYPCHAFSNIVSSLSPTRHYLFRSPLSSQFGPRSSWRISTDILRCPAFRPGPGSRVPSCFGCCKATGHRCHRSQWPTAAIFILAMSSAGSEANESRSENVTLRSEAKQWAERGKTELQTSLAAIHCDDPVSSLDSHTCKWQADANHFFAVESKFLKFLGSLGPQSLSPFSFKFSEV